MNTKLLRRLNALTPPAPRPVLTIGDVSRVPDIAHQWLKFESQRVVSQAAGGVDFATVERWWSGLKVRPNTVARIEAGLVASGHANVVESVRAYRAGE